MVLSKTGAKWFYVNMMQQNHVMAFKGKWSDDLNLHLDPITWKQMFLIGHKTVSDYHLTWFQYKILHRILGTQKLLHQMGKSDSDKCLLCQSSTESLVHLFSLCPKVAQIWQDLSNWIKERTNINIKFDSFKIIMGYLNRENFFLPINTIILVTKYYIYSNTRTKQCLNIADLQMKVKEVYNEQNLVAKLNCSENKFEEKWLSFNKLLA